MFYGSIPALITPFKNGEVDLKAFADFIEWQVANGSHGVVPCGTTGESPVLDDEEYRSIFAMTVSVVKGRIPVIAGTGSNSTRKAIQLTKIAKECGVDAALIVVPYYTVPLKMVFMLISRPFTMQRICQLFSIMFLGDAGLKSLLKQF